MALETSKKQFNPVSERDFGLQLRCGNYYTVGTDIPSNPEEKAIIITNLRYDFNYQQSLMNVVKKFGPVEKLHYRFMKMRHIALVEFKDHKSALRFKMAPGNLSTKQPSTRKFWRLILPVPDNDAGFAAVQAHLSQPPVKRNNLTQPPALTQPQIPSKGLVKRNNVSRKIPSTCSTKSQMQGSRDNFEMHVPAVVPSLEETGSRNSTSSTLSVAPRRKPMLKLSCKPKRLDPVSTNDIEIIDLEAVSQDSVHDEYVIVIKPIVIIDNETVHPMKTFNQASAEKEKGRATSISATPSHSMDVKTTTSEQHPTRTETGTGVITVTPQLVMNVNTGTSQHMDVNTVASQHVMDVNTGTSQHMNVNTGTSQHMDVNTGTSQHMDVNTGTSQHMDVNTGTSQHMDVNTVASQHVMDVNTGTSQHMDVNTGTSQHMDVNTGTSQHMDVNTGTSQHMDVNTGTSQHMDVNTGTSQHMDVNTVASQHVMDVNTGTSQHMDVNTGTSQHMDVNTGTSQHMDVNTVTSQHMDVNTGTSQHMAVNTGTSQHMAVNTGTSQHMDVTTPFFTPAGLRLIPHSFKILPPPNSGMEYIITGSLRPTVGLHRNLVLRGIPYELNIESNLRLLTSFGRCKIMPRYLGLRTTAYVMYCNNIDPINCFNGAYKVLNLEYLKVFWMEKLPLPNPKDPTSPTCINEDTDEVELECAPGDLQTRKIQFKALRQKMRAYKTQRKEHAREKIDKNFRWKPSGIVKAKLIMKNQTLMSNNINSQKIILTRLESCENADTRERLMAMLKKLEKTHLVTTANLKVLSTSSEPGEQSVEQPEQQPVPTPSQPPQPEQQPVPAPSQQQVPIPSNPYPRIIKIVNFSDQDVLQNHFRKFGKCTVVSYVVDSSNVILCKFEESKEAVLAFEKGRELVWYEWRNKKDMTLELEWDDEQTVETQPVPTQSKSNDFVPSNLYPRNIKIVNFSDQDVLHNHFHKFGKCTVVSYVVNNSTVILCKFEKRKEAVVAFVRGREMVWSEWGNKKEMTLELEWDFSASVE